jgi:hypothetical protein
MSFISIDAVQNDGPERQFPLLRCPTFTPYLRTRPKGFADTLTGNRLYPSSIRRPRTIRRYGLRLEGEPTQRTHLVPFSRRGGDCLPDEESCHYLLRVCAGLSTPGVTQKMVSASQVTRMNRHFDLAPCTRHS